MDFKPVGQQAQDNQAVTEYNIQDDRVQLTKQLHNSKELDNIVSTVSVYDVNTIVTFGSGAAEEISRCSDQILNSVNLSQLNDSGELLNQLAKIMDKFDLNELVEDVKKSVLDRFFSNVKKQLESLLNKYHTMGEEVDKIYVQLKSYESEIYKSNDKLESMFKTNVSYYHELVKYIMAGEQAVSEIDNHLAELRREFEGTNDPMLQLDINNVEQAKNMLEQRLMDLKMAENIAMQSIPMIKTMQFGNYNLIRKINSAFIVTLPVFKQALTQAILLKRQRIQAESLKALDDRTNEMLLKNAQNIANQTRITAELASNSSIQIETLEESWRTIVKGIEDTKQIQESAKKKRVEDSQRLNQLKESYKNQFGVSPERM